MLVLRRKVGQTIVIDQNIVVTVQRVEGNRVSLSIEAPQDVRILRGELQPFDADVAVAPCHDALEPFGVRQIHHCPR